MAAAAGAAQPGGTDDVEPEVALLPHGRLAGVQPDPHPHLGPVGPVVGDVRALHLGRCRDGVACADEREEERVALRVDLDAVVGGEGVADKPSMVGEDGRVTVAELLQQRGRSLDVRERERHRAAGQLGHGSILALVLTEHEGSSPHPDANPPDERRALS